MFMFVFVDLKDILITYLFLKRLLKILKIYNVSPINLDEIKNKLPVLQNQKKKNRSLSSFSRTHIINYFVPIFLFQDKFSKTKEELIKDF